MSGSLPAAIVVGVAIGIAHGSARALGVLANMRNMDTAYSHLLILGEQLRWLYRDGLALPTGCRCSDSIYTHATGHSLISAVTSRWQSADSQCLPASYLERGQRYEFNMGLSFAPHVRMTLPSGETS